MPQSIYDDVAFIEELNRRERVEMVVDIYESADAVKIMKRQKMPTQRGNQECKPQLEEIIQEADATDRLLCVWVCCVCWLPSQCCA
ncbi:hypothetical protein SRHO_G00250200 [Serrasalmus rhombeus]